MKTGLQTKISPFTASEIMPVLREHRYLTLIIVVYSVAAIGMSRQLGAGFDLLSIYQGFGTSLLIGPLFALFGYAIYVMIFIRPQQLTRFLMRSVNQYLTRERLLYALPVLFLFPLFASSFTIFKAAIPLFHPYEWDSKLAAWDMTMHGGIHPWVWLQYAMGYPLVTAAINFAYHLWFFIVYAFLYWLSFSTDKPVLRMQFLLSFVITWIVFGNIVAMLFSSMGPCYYGFLTQGNNNPYLALMTYLQDANKYVPIWALDVQKMLLDGYRDKSQVAVLGISALPSMHVATAVLLALAGWRINRAAGVALSIYAVIIMIGSVHLGWHYALDGYVGTAGAYVVWRVVGWMVSQSLPRSLAETSLANPQTSYLA